MPVEDVFSITGRGTVATGRVERGKIKVSEEVEIVGFNPTIKTLQDQIDYSTEHRTDHTCTKRGVKDLLTEDHRVCLQ